MSGALELRQEAGGDRHYLDGLAVHAGDLLELLEGADLWTLGRYEWNWRFQVPPVLYVGERKLRELPAGAVLRWPSGSR